jgi:tRNA pseudouridine38-40 synthase
MTMSEIPQQDQPSTTTPTTPARHTQRYKLTIAYRGTRYHGWQAQAAMDTYKGDPPPPGEGIPTIQESLQRAMGEVVGHPVTLQGSSRTDSGVHAKGQIATFDTPSVHIPIEGLRRAVNARLPTDILIHKLEPVPVAFDAVRGTASKRYQFFIWNHKDRPVFFSDLAWHRWHYLDVPKIQQAARHFVGTHDFASFARPGHMRESTVRTVFACDVHWRKPKLIIGVEGSGFLWNMVRIMVGTLVEVGMGRHEPDAIVEMIAAKDRKAAGPTAPPHGLFLQWIRMKPLVDAPGEADLLGKSEPAQLPPIHSDESGGDDTTAPDAQVR